MVKVRVRVRHVVLMVRVTVGYSKSPGNECNSMYVSPKVTQVNMCGCGCVCTGGWVWVCTHAHPSAVFVTCIFQPKFTHIHT